MNQVQNYLKKHKVDQSQVEDAEKRQIWEDLKANAPEFANFIRLLIKQSIQPENVSYEAK